MKYEGNAALAKIVSVIQPTVTSRSIIRVDELNQELMNEATLAISFPLPGTSRDDVGPLSIAPLTPSNPRSDNTLS